jgi:hypothetical protein
VRIYVIYAFLCIFMHDSRSEQRLKIAKQATCDRLTGPEH